MMRLWHLLILMYISRYGAIVMDDQNDDGSLGFTVLHNSSCQHAGPTFINVMNTAILRLATGNRNMTIRTRNHPLPTTQSQQLQRHVCFLIFGVSYCFTLKQILLEANEKANGLNFYAEI